jgi:large subunit ribosomal protein L25
MKSVAISGSRRANVGKKDAKALRLTGLVPCVLYGGPEQIPFAVDAREFKKIYFTPDVKSIDISVDGKNYKGILQEVQLHPVTDSIIHADFREVIAGKPVTVKLPVTFEGNAVGVRSGGKLIRKMRKLTVCGPIEKMPDSIVVNIEKIEIGQMIRVCDLSFDGLEILELPNNTVVTVQVTRNVVEEATPAAKAAAPAAKAAAPAAAAPAKAPAKK